MTSSGHLRKYEDESKASTETRCQCMRSEQSNGILMTNTERHTRLVPNSGITVRTISTSKAVLPTALGTGAEGSLPIQGRYLVCNLFGPRTPRMGTAKIQKSRQVRSGQRHVVHVRSRWGARGIKSSEQFSMLPTKVLRRLSLSIQQ